MTTGTPSPWGPGPSDSPSDPYAARYVGPWGPPVVPDEVLRRLPPPAYGPPPPGASAVHPDQRPAVIGLAVTLAVTAALLWVCGLSLFLLVALAGTRVMSPTGDDGYVFHTLHESLLRMSDGLWLPLYGFPLASVVTAFLLLARRPWARLVHSGVGLASLGWAGWWLRDSLLTWVVVVVYVGIAVVVLWTPAVGRWYAARPRRAA